MPQIIEVPELGEVEFPDEMSDDDIATAIRGSLTAPAASAVESRQIPVPPPPAEVTQAEEQQAIEMRPAPQGVMRNAVEGVGEAAAAMVPRDLLGVASLINPAVMAGHSASNFAKVVHDIYKGEPVIESLVEHEPLAAEMFHAEQTPEYSKERFRAGTSLLLQVGMLYAGAKGAMKGMDAPPVKAAAEQAAPDIVPPVEAPNIQGPQVSGKTLRAPAVVIGERVFVGETHAHAAENARRAGFTTDQIWEANPDLNKWQSNVTLSDIKKGEVSLETIAPEPLIRVPGKSLPDEVPPLTPHEEMVWREMLGKPEPEPPLRTPVESLPKNEATPETIPPPAEPGPARTGTAEPAPAGDIAGRATALGEGEGIGPGTGAASPDAPAQVGRQIQVAVRTKDGKIHSIPQNEGVLHAQVSEKYNLNPSDIQDGGYLVNGKYQTENPINKLADLTDAEFSDTVKFAHTKQIAEQGGKPAPEPLSPGPGAASAKEPLATKVPEHLRTASDVQRLLDEPEAQTGPQMKTPDVSEGGALLSAGGKRQAVTAKGTTPRGDTEFLRIEPGWKRTLQGLEREGGADVVGKTRNQVGQKLAEAMRKHVDTEQELFGNLQNEFQQATKGMNRAATDKAFAELAPYLAAKENGRPLPAISPAAQKLLNAWENIAEKTGQIASANNVQVFDPTTGAHRPMHTMGRQYVPRMMKREVEQVMRDPDSNPALWNNLVDDYAKQRGITDTEAAQALRAEAGHFSSNDFMGNLEMARIGKLPESFYEYDLRNLAARYLPGFSERMAQIIAYGQRLGSRESPSRPNLWDVARKESADTFTQDWLTSAEDQATNLKLKGASRVGMARAQTAATGLLLSSPTTTVMRNLFSGASATPELLGYRRSVKGFVDTVKSAQARMDAKEIGVIRDNIGDFLHADKLGESMVDDAIRTVVDKGLKYSGYNGSEVFVRTHGAMTAAQFARDAVSALNKNPASMRSKEALGLFKRMGVDGEKIVAEGADYKTGPETRKFIRTVVRDTQGGYRFDQVPLWANSNMGRFFYQFGRWGTQRARNIWNNGIKPAIGEEVQWHGKTMVRRDIRPLAKMAVNTVLLGETFGGIAQILFGRDRKDASLTEIAEAWEEDKKQAVALAGERMINDVIMAGTLGIWSQPVDWAKGLKDQSRLKNPSEPPGLGSVRSTMELGQNFLDQGTVTQKDMLNWASSFAPGVKQVTDVARNVMDEPLYEAENDVRTLRTAARRWARTEDMDVAAKSKNTFRKSKMAPEYEPIKAALLTGNAQHARYLADTFLDKQPDREKAEKSLKASVKQSQPFRVGPYTSEEYRNDFRDWAVRNLNKADFQQTERVQERYKKAAETAKLW